MNPVRAGAILVAAGRSERMGGVDKVLIDLNGRPLIAHSLATFAACPRITRIALVASQSNFDALTAIAKDFARDIVVVQGGARRRDSVAAGLDALAGSDYIVIHDGARPLVTHDLIETALDAAIETGASLCAVPVSDTVKRSNQAGLVRGTVSRQDLWLAQTPQAFRRDLILRAHASTDVDATDDAALIEWLAEPVRIVPGSGFNLKITTPDDIRLAEAIMRANLDSARD